MTTRLKTLLLAGVATLSASAAFAQQAEMPEFLSQLDGVAYQGQLAGMDIYSLEGYQGIWMVSPDGRTAMAGTVFSNDGRDLGSAFTGGQPVRAFEIAPEAAQPVVAEPATGQTSPGVSLIPEGGVLTSDEITAMESGLENIEAQIDSLGPVGTSGTTAGEAPAAEEASKHAATDAASVTEDMHATLEGFSEADKKILMAALVELLKDVKNEQEFQTAVQVWTEEIVRRHKEAEAAPTEDHSELRHSETQNEPQPEAAVKETAVEQSAVETVVAEGVASDEQSIETTGDTVADTLLKEVRTDAMWFGIGKMDAPVAYAFIDPTCPYCAKTIANLEGSIASGELQLRIILAPVLSERSGKYIASILLADEPPIAFLEHELGLSGGRSPLKPGNWEDLPGQLRDSLIHNANIMREYEIPGVPFLIFNTEEGAKVINGVPSPEALSTALPDSYLGNK